MVHCWIARYEAMGFRDPGDAIVALGRDGLKEIWGLSGRTEDPDLDPDPWTVADPLYDICMAEEDHTGVHDFTPTDEIVLTFTAPGPM